MYLLMNFSPDYYRALLSRLLPRTALLSAFAAAAAYGIGSAVPMVSAVVAAITALIAVRPTLHASIQEALRQVLGVVIGAVVAFAALELVGFSVVALFAAILVCFLVAGWLKIGEDGALAVGVTVILVVGPHFNTVSIETRLFGVVLGSLIALITSYFARPGTPHARALADATTQGDRSAKLLLDVADRLALQHGPVSAVVAQDWLDQAEDIQQQIDRIAVAAEDAVEGAQWSPLIRREEATAVLAQVRITESTAVAVVSICQDLRAMAYLQQPLPETVAVTIGKTLSATADAIGQQSTTARGNPSRPLNDDTGTLRVVRRARGDAVSVVRDLDETGPLLLGGALLRDLDKITKTLSGQ